MATEATDEKVEQEPGVDEPKEETSENQGVDQLTQIFNNYESDVQGKMLSKYFSKALVDAGIELPEVEVRDLTFIADPKSCGWIKKEDFIRVTNLAKSQQDDTAKLKDLFLRQFKGQICFEDVKELVKGADGFDETLEEELKQVMESFHSSDSYQKDKSMDVNQFIWALLHPENKGSGSPLDNISINLAQ